MAEPPQTLQYLRLTMVCCALSVLAAAQYALLSASWYSLHFIDGTGPALPVEPLYLAIVVVIAAIGAVGVGALYLPNWTVPATLLGLGLGFVLFSLFTWGGYCLTAGQALSQEPTIEFSSKRVHGSISTLAVVLSGDRCGAFFALPPVIAGYLLIGLGLWLDPWTDMTLANVVSAINTRLHKR
ncbi:hypothetical protein ACFR9U_20190 [Halorientalis brevis]|uniref:Uncharacterized protein n=1 Tax=Halorientalis brevis TaxID=1126241 RepID=A0ABD6CHI1_9EURY|nr:hypothetical protein [Halorientalis brevis]